jgi:hypothetical protein
MNDYYSPPEDRNAAFDRLTIAPVAALRITGFAADAAGQTATLQWEATPGKSYEVLVASNLPPAAWEVATTFTNHATVAGWQDTGDLSREPPLSPAAPRRFYRIRQMGP